MNLHLYSDKPRKGRPGGFTLIELLVVVAIIGILAALLFPVFARVKASSRNAVCQSNLKQIGYAIQTYSQDWDGIYPLGLDFADTSQEGQAAYATFPDDLNPDGYTIFKGLVARPDRGGYVDQVLKPYVKAQEVWHCPSDVGLHYYTIPEPGGSSLIHGAVTDGVPAYDAFKMSYGYRSELGLAGWTLDQGKETSNLVVMSDMAGYWHTRFSRTAVEDADHVADVKDVQKWALNVLYGDGHVRYTPWNDYRNSWNTVGPIAEWYADYLKHLND